MGKIFIGILLVFLDFNLNVGNSSIALLPDFIGYIVMGNGIGEMRDYGDCFARMKPYAIGMALYTGIFFFVALFGILAPAPVISYILGLISTIFALYISYNLVMGVKDVEIITGQALNWEELYGRWKVMAVFGLLVTLLFWIPVLNIVLVIVNFIVAICFLVSFNRAKNAYENPLL